MAIPLPNEKLRAYGEERRRFQRVRVDLLGRYMLPDRREFPCQVVNMSPGGMALIAPVSGITSDQRPPIGTLVTLGKVQGRVVRHLEEGFAIEFTRLQHPDFLEDVIGPS